MIKAIFPKMNGPSIHSDDLNIKTAILHPRQLIVDFSKRMVRREQIMITLIDQF